MLLASTLMQDKKMLSKVMMGITEVVALVFGTIPATLSPIYAAALESLVAGLLPDDHAKAIYDDLKRSGCFGCVTIKGEAFGKKGENEDEG